MAVFISWHLITLILFAAAVALLVTSRSRSLHYNGKVFRPGDKVRIHKRAGTKKPEATGHNVEVDSGPGQTGVVLKKLPRGGQFSSDPDDWLLNVRWDAQEWKEYETGQKIILPQFDDTIHPDYLERI